MDTIPLFDLSKTILMLQFTEEVMFYGLNQGRINQNENQQ